MVQVLPTATSFGEKLVDKLSEAGTKIYYGHQQRRAAKMDRAALQSLQDESKSPMEKIALISQLSPQTAAIAVPLYAPLLKQQAKQQETQNLLGQLGFSQGLSQPQMNITSIQQSPQMMSESGRDMGNPPSEEGVSPGQPNNQRMRRDQNDPKTWSDEEVQRNRALLSVNDPSAQLFGQMAEIESERRQEERKSLASEKSEAKKEERESFKATQAYRDKLLDSYQAAKSTNARLDRMQELNDEGKLATPALASALDKFGIPISILSNPQSEEFAKLSQDLMGNITQTYGNKILQVEVENFLKTIPTLINSEEGRSRIIRNMKLLMKPKQLEYDAYKEIRKKGGSLPFDLREQILEKIEPQVEKAYEELSEDPIFSKKRDNSKNSIQSSSERKFVTIISPSGIAKKIPEEMLEEALKAGGRRE